MVNYLAPNLTLKRFFCSNFTLLELNFKVLFLIPRQWYFIEHLKIGQDFMSSEKSCSLLNFELLELNLEQLQEYFLKLLKLSCIFLSGLIN